MASATAPYYSRTQESVFEPDAVDEGQSYEEHSEVYNQIARSLAPDAAMHAYVRNGVPSGGYTDSMHEKGSPSGMALSADEDMVGENIDMLNREVSDDAQGSATDTDNQIASNNHFAGLLEAVTTAAGQEAAQGHATNGGSTSNLSNRPKRTTRQSRVVADQASGDIPPRVTGKRKRTSTVAQTHCENTERSSAVETGLGSLATSTAPRKRVRVAGPSYDSESDNANGAYSAGHTSAVDEGYSNLEIRELPPQLAISDARAVGVHSAAALFRHPSASSKKYTRPPMSRLFTSLELSPENFLRLQAAAKSYMLNKAYPERQDCVGNRGKGDTDMVKLRLYNCVKDFLEVEGFGNKYFGKSVLNDGMGDRKFTWPAHKNKVIALVTPLLRRMVTNERQRQYAVVTRKGPGGRSGGSSSGKKRRAAEMETPPRDTDVQSGYDLQDLDIDPNLELGAPCVGIQHSLYSEDGRIAERLTELRNLSRLPTQEWNAMVDKVFDHVRGEHHHDSSATNCEDGCHEILLTEEAKNGLLSHCDWGFSEGATDEEKYANALLVLRDLFGFVRSVVNEEKRAQSLQASASRMQKITNTEGLATNQTCQESSSGAMPLGLHINIVKDDGERIRPRIHLEADAYPTYQSLYQAIFDNFPNDDSLESFGVQVHDSSGLRTISNTDEWTAATAWAKQTSWIDDLTIVVTVAEAL